MSVDPGFSAPAYAALIDRLRRSGYAVRDYFDAQADAQHLVLRHDIDMCLASALRMARLEHSHGIRSTYFVLVRSELYNPFAAPEHDALRQIVRLGHGVGLHFDAAQYEASPDALDEGAAHECALLEALLGQAVALISLHRPAPALLGSPTSLGGRAHVYQPRWFSDMGYCSDSRGDWHHGAPLAQPCVQERRALQLLTHPIWWTGPCNGPAAAVLDALVAGSQARFKSALARECSVYRT